MSKFEEKFFSLLKEDEEVSALAASPEDDAEALARALDKPEDAEELGGNGHTGDVEEVPEINVNYGKDLDTLETWINDLTEFKSYLNGDSESILGRLRDESKIGTLFDDIDSSTKSNILDIAEKLAALIEQFRNLHTEKHK